MTRSRNHPGIGDHRAADVLGDLGALIFIELAEDRVNDVTGDALAHLLGNRHELDLALGEFAPVALKLELIAEERSEAVYDDEIVRAFATYWGSLFGFLDFCFKNQANITCK